MLRLLQHAALLVATAILVAVLVNCREVSRKQPGEAPDLGQTVEELRSRAEQGDTTAQNTLGMLYHEGDVVLQDYAEAVKWFRLAAEQGNASAQYSLGARYSEGQGVPQDYVQAHKWLNLAASRESVTGILHVGFASARDNVGGKMTPAQIAEAHRLAREWKPRTWDELKGQVTQ